jgi:serine/threonine protein kinase
MSPEQARGEHAGPETDLWGLGATLYFAVEGVPPFDAGQAVPTLNAVVHDEPRRMERAGSLAPVISALLAKDPGSRPSGAELERMLESDGASPPAVSQEPTEELNGAATAILPGPVGTPTPTTRLEPTGDAARPSPGDGNPVRRRLALGAAIAALVVIAVLAYAAFGGDSLPQRRDLVGSRRTHVASTTTTPRRSQPSRDATPSVAPTTPSQGVPKPAGGGTGPNGNAYGHGNGQGHGNGENNGNGNAYGQGGEGD